MQVSKPVESGECQLTAASPLLPFPSRSRHGNRTYTRIPHLLCRGRKGNRRTASDSSSCTGIGLNATEALHTDPLTRQLMLMLMAVETKAKISTPEEGGGGVNREWVK